MILSGRRAASIWETGAQGLRAAIAKAIFHCACGRSTRCLIFRTRTRRGPTSPDAVGYAVGADPQQQPEQPDAVQDDMRETREES